MSPLPVKPDYCQVNVLLCSSKCFLLTNDHHILRELLKMQTVQPHTRPPEWELTGSISLYDLYSHYHLRDAGSGVMRMNAFNFLLFCFCVWFKPDLGGRNNYYRTICPAWNKFCFSSAAVWFQTKQIKIKLTFSWKIQMGGKSQTFA